MRIVIFISLLLTFLYSAQSQISINTGLSKKEVELGEELTLDISIAFPQGIKITGVNYEAFDSIVSEANWSAIPDSLQRENIFAEIEWPRDDIFPNNIWPVQGFQRNGNVLLKSIPIRIWDVGVFTLPQLKIELDSSTSIQEIEYLESPQVTVIPPLDINPPDSSEAIMPIKDILVENRTWEDFIWLAYILAGLLTLALIIFMVYRTQNKKLEQPEKAEIKRPAHELGFEKLDELKRKELWQKGQIKDYQSELTYIIREYLENRFEIKALESTTYEIVEDLKQKDFDLTQENNLREILQIADLVKFAKAEPGAEIHSSFMDRAYELIDQTKLIIAQIEESNMESNDE